MAWENTFHEGVIGADFFVAVCPSSNPYRRKVELTESTARRHKERVPLQCNSVSGVLDNDRKASSVSVQQQYTERKH